MSKKGTQFQEFFRRTILNKLGQHKLKTLTKLPFRLPVLIRYSSDNPYHYSDSSQETEQGTLSVVGKTPIKNLGWSDGRIIIPCMNQSEIFAFMALICLYMGPINGMIFGILKG